MRSLHTGLTALLCIMLLSASLLAQEAEPVKLPTSVDLRPRFAEYGLKPKRQGRRPTCSVCVTTSAFEFALAREQGTGTPLSAEYFNWAANQVIGNKTKDRGQFFHHLLKGFERFGVCSEAAMPYQKRFSGEQPSQDARAEALQIKDHGFAVHWIRPLGGQGLEPEHMTAIKTVLAKGFPVAAGSHHSLLIVGYEDDSELPGGGRFFVADSGKGRFDVRTYAFVKKRMGDVYWVEVATPEPDESARTGD